VSEVRDANRGSTEGATLLVEGVAAAAIDLHASGRACVVRSLTEAARCRPGDVLVTVGVDADWMSLLRQAAAVVTDLGDRYGRAAALCRQLGVPAVVGTGNATAAIPNGWMVTVSCAGGAGRVFACRPERRRRVASTGGPGPRAAAG
jgi:pyruvate,water dikinase